MKRSFLRLALLLLLSVPLAVLAHQHMKHPADGWEGNLLALVVKHGTSCVEQYSEARFAQVSAGMTGEQVERLLGIPVWRGPLGIRPGAIAWSYCHSFAGASYRARYVDFVGERVVGTEGRFVRVQ